MVARLPLLAAVAALGLAACNEDGFDDPITPTPTPTATPGPTVTPTPTPSDDDDGLSDDDDFGSDIDDSGGAGAPMTSASEAVAITEIDLGTGAATALTIVRSNGEVWIFELPGQQTAQVGETIVYRNAAFVFGSVDGELVLADGSVSQIDASARIQ
jgi:hypothetical protein